MNDSIRRARFSGLFRRQTLPRVLLTLSCLTLAGGAAAQQGPASQPQADPPKDDTPRAPTLNPATTAAPPPAATPAPAAPAPVLNAGPEGFTISSADKQYQLKLRGVLQADARYFAEGKERNGNNTFLLRRFQPALDATVAGLVDVRFLLDLAPNAQPVQDGYVDIHPAREFRIRVGKFKAPVGLERLQPTTALMFPEFALPTSLVPNREVGIQFSGDIAGGVLSYAVGAFNGSPDGGAADLNVDDNVELEGRLFSHPFRKSGLKLLEGLGLGIAGTVGSEYGTLGATQEPTLRAEGQQTFFTYLSGATADVTVLASGRHYRFSPQAYYFTGPLGVMAEYVASTQDVRRGGEEARLTNTAWQLSASYVLFGGKASYEGLKPEHTINPAAGHWGAVELVGRYSGLRIDPNAFPIFADPARSASGAQSWGFGAHWYLSGNTRITFTGERTAFTGGAAEGGSRPTEFVFFNRVQVYF
ncbi:OprO/OprP family phosphate-selective porin [Cystobacter fuscus]|uniref:OprO/OprP family phosphate-selective porin n=1 Tax=Cystobacter fuscus TaxID=43 RepID=UPI002B319632|nr:porin [Cystobacter fuscus]